MSMQSNGSSDVFTCLNNFHQLKRFRKIFIGNNVDARNCNYLELAMVLHNWPSQWHSRFPKGYIQLLVIRNKQFVNFDIALNSIDGKSVYIFPEQPEIKRLQSEKEINAERQTIIECAQNFVAQGNEQQKDGNWYGAACKYEHAIELNPQDAQAYSLLGYALLKLGKYKKTIYFLTRGISVTSEGWILARMHDARGLAKSNAGDIEGAKCDFKEALKYSRRSPRILVHAGVLEERAEQFEMAYTYALRALSYNTTYPPALQLKKRLEDSGQVKPLRLNLGGLAA